MQGIPDIGTEASSLSSWISQAPAFLMANAHAAHTSAVHEAAPVQLMENPVARALLNTTTGWGVILYSLLLGIGQVRKSHFLLLGSSDVNTWHHPSISP